MQFKKLYEDPVIEEPGFPPDSMAVVINSSGKNLYGVLYTAAGMGPHPAMILLHGFPGTERNLDMAHAFRRAGWNTLVFHYRGSWGSEGCFSFQNVLDDVKAAIEFVKSEESARKYRIDRDNTVLVGHSMGGFAALLTAAEYSDIKACVAIAPFDFGAIGESSEGDDKALRFLQGMFRECIVPLKGTAVEELINEATVNGDKWSFINNAEKLAGHKLLLIAAKKDNLSIPELHYYPLVNKMLMYNTENFEYKMIDSDHSFQDKRILLTEIIEGWLEKQVQQNSNIK
ncbi:MAG TPA: alpha/beta fold hydrolase [Bacillota bacterium]|nr:alpha/beta fold hydrolase [Bacillota bacterium]